MIILCTNIFKNPNEIIIYERLKPTANVSCQKPTYGKNQSPNNRIISAIEKISNGTRQRCSKNLEKT